MSTTLTYGLNTPALPEPLPVTAPSPEPVGAEPAPSASRPKFRGIARPLREDPSGSGFRTASGVDLFLANVGQILGTPIGSIPWRPEFGSKLSRARHQNNNAVLAELVRVRTIDALARWEPRARVRDVALTRSGAPSVERRNVLLAKLRLDFVVRGAVLARNLDLELPI